MRGFSLVELIVVLALMGVLASVAMPRFIDRNALQERGFRDQLQGLLEHARKLAIAQQREVCVLLAPAPVRAVYARAGACNAALPVAEPSGLNPYVIAVPNGVALSGVPLVRFNARGQPVPNATQAVGVGVLSLVISRETGLVR